jgi:mRNA interferase RelE/StbE
VEVIADKSFERDFKKLPPGVKMQITKVYEEMIKAEGISFVKNTEKMSGAKDHYKTRIGDWRIGSYIKGKTLYLSRVLNRKEIYKYFPQK